MKKLSVCVLFGGVSPEHEVSLRSAESVLNNLDKEKYNVFPVGITKDGDWVLFGGTDYSMLPAGTWLEHEENRRAAISPVRGQGLLSFENDCVVRERIDVVMPVLHGENGEDGSVQGLMQVAGIPCVGPGVAASAVGMDKTLSKLVVADAGIRQANWYLARRETIEKKLHTLVYDIEQGGDYPLFVKPAGTGSSVGVSKVRNTEELKLALVKAAEYCDKVLVEEFIRGREVEVAVLGNREPMASVVGEVLAGADFYDYEAKYHSQESRTEIPADISDAEAEKLRDAALTVYRAVGCRGLSRVDFFLSEAGEVVFNEINTLPGFTSISMYPQLFEACGVPNEALIDELLTLAMEE